MRLGETSLSDIFGKFVTALPDIAASYATYDLNKDLIKAKTATPSATQYLPYTYTTASSPIYSTPAQTGASNTMIYLALGGAVLLLFLAMRKG